MRIKKRHALFKEPNQLFAKMQLDVLLYQDTFGTNQACSDRCYYLLSILLAVNQYCLDFLLFL